MRIVTALYDIRGDTTPSGIRRIQDYLELGRDTLLRLEVPMTLFTGSEALAGRIRELSTNPRLEVLVEPFEESEFYGDLALIEQRLREYPIENRNADKDTALYLILNHSKMHYLHRAMARHPSDAYFLWLDLGVQHAAKASREEWDRVEKEWPAFLAEEAHHHKIHQLCVHTVMKHPWTPWKQFFTSIYHHIGGGCIGGHRDALGWYRTAFWGLWRKILHEECWVQLDEALFTILVEENPERFRLYYGDYDAMVTNFIESKRSWFLVFQTLERHLNGHRVSQVHEVLDTLDPVLPRLLDPSVSHHLVAYMTAKIRTQHRLEIMIGVIPWEIWNRVQKDLLEHAPVSFLLTLSEHDPGNKATLAAYRDHLTNAEGIVPVPGASVPLRGKDSTGNGGFYASRTVHDHPLGTQVRVEIHSDIHDNLAPFLYSIPWCPTTRFQEADARFLEAWEKTFVTRPWG